MATRDQVVSALIAARQSGNAEDVQRLTDHLAEMTPMKLPPINIKVEPTPVEVNVKPTPVQIINEITGPKPTVTVQVQPAPPTPLTITPSKVIVQMVEREPSAGKWEFVPTYYDNGQIKKITATRV